MLIEGSGAGKSVDIERELGRAGDLQRSLFASGGEHQAIVRQCNVAFVAADVDGLGFSVECRRNADLELNPQRG